LDERWRVPVIPLKVEPTDEITITRSGRVMRDYRFVFRREDIERMRAGYVCIRCFEPHEHAWPERCHLCGLEMRAKQAHFFSQWFDPQEEVVRISRDWEAEMEGLDERRRKEEERARKDDQQRR